MVVSYRRSIGGRPLVLFYYFFFLSDHNTYFVDITDDENLCNKAVILQDSELNKIGIVASLIELCFSKI